MISQRWKAQTSARQQHPDHAHLFYNFKHPNEPLPKVFAATMEDVLLPANAETTASEHGSSLMCGPDPRPLSDSIHTEPPPLHADTEAAVSKPGSGLMFGHEPGPLPGLIHTEPSPVAANAEVAASKHGSGQTFGPKPGSLPEATNTEPPTVPGKDPLLLPSNSPLTSPPKTPCLGTTSPWSIPNSRRRTASPMDFSNTIQGDASPSRDASVGHDVNILLSALHGLKRKRGAQETSDSSDDEEGFEVEEILAVRGDGDVR